MSDVSDEFEFPDLKDLARPSRQTTLAAQPAAVPVPDSTAMALEATTADAGDNDEEEHEIAKIVDWRFAATASKTKPATTKRINDTHLYDIELHIHWEGDLDPQEYTWEPESSLQMTAGPMIWAFWQSCAASLGPQTSKGPKDPRDRVLGLSSKRRMYVPLRVVDQRNSERNGRSTGNLEYLVEWVGYEEKTWEPKRNLVGNDVLDEYYATIDEEHGV